MVSIVYSYTTTQTQNTFRIEEKKILIFFIRVHKSKHILALLVASISLSLFRTFVDIWCFAAASKWYPFDCAFKLTLNTLLSVRGYILPVV